MSLSSQTYNVPNFPLSTTSRPSLLSLCHPPFWAPFSSLKALGHPHRHLSAALSQLLASSHLNPSSLFLSQCPKYTSMPLKPEHGTLSKCRFWFIMSCGARGWSAILHLQQAPRWYPCHCPWAALCGKTIQPDCPIISLVGPAFPQKILYCKIISYHLYQPPFLSSCCLKHISGEQMNKMIQLKNRWLIHSPYLLSPFYHRFSMAVCVDL